MLIKRLKEKSVNSNKSCKGGIKIKDMVPGARFSKVPVSYLAR